MPTISMINGSTVSLVNPTPYILEAIGVTSGNFILPLISWDTNSYPLSVYKQNGEWNQTFEKSEYFPESMWKTTWYVDISAASNVGPGTSWATAYKSIYSAISAGNATNAPFKVYVKSGTYPRANGLTNSGAVLPTQSCAIIAYGGRVVAGTFDTLSWSGPDATYTNCYTAARSSCAKVVDLLNTTFEHYVVLANVANAATCNSTPNSWAQVGGTIYVNRADAAAVTNSNTRVYLSNVYNLRFSSSNVRRAYVYGFDLEGGGGGGTSPAKIVNCSNFVFMAEDCSFSYGGSTSEYDDGVAILDSSGLFVFSGCSAKANNKDGFNAHWMTNSTRSTYVITDRCKSRDNGSSGSSSNNGITGHETVVWIDVEGDYAYDRGGEVRFIDNSRLACFGSFAGFDQGDGGSTQKAGFDALNTCVMYAIDCSCEMSAIADVAVSGNATGSYVYIRNFDVIQGTIGTSNVVEF